MRLLLDQGLPRTAAEVLRDRGCDVVHVAEIGMASASDEAILNRAVEEQRVCVTLDADFHAILAVKNLSAPSVIRFRKEGLRGPELANELIGVCTQIQDALEAGAMVTVTHTALRVHRLKAQEESR